MAHPTTIQLREVAVPSWHLRFQSHGSRSIAPTSYAEVVQALPKSKPRIPPSTSGSLKPRSTDHDRPFGASIVPTRSSSPAADALIAADIPWFNPTLTDLVSTDRIEPP